MRRHPKNHDSTLWRCCAVGDAPGVAFALSQGASPNALLAAHGWGRAALGRAVGFEHLEGLTPLTLCARLGGVKTFDALWAAGADPLARTASGMGTVTAAFKSRKFPIALAAIVRFKEAGLAPEKGALGEAVMWGQKALIRHLLAMGAHPNEEHEGDTPMTLAAKRGLPWTLRLLAEAGGDIDAPRPLDGARALAIAAKRGDVACMEEAIGLGADLDAVDAQGRSALHACALNESPAAAACLARHGAFLEEPWPVGGMTPLGRAAQGERAQTMQVLIECGANPRHVGSFGHLHGLNALLATLHPHDPRDRRARDPLGSMRVAIAAGVDLEACDSAGQWALYTIFHGGLTLDKKQERAELLFLAGADLEHPNSKGQTMLEMEVLRCLTPGYGVSQEPTRKLLARGALVTDAIKEALAKQAHWEPTYQKGWSLEWVDWVKAAALRQDEERELARVALPGKSFKSRRM